MLREPPFDGLSGIERARRFAPDAVNVRAAREFVADELFDQGFRGDPDVVLLLASELVTNAVRHAATPFEIAVDVRGDGEVVVAVEDGDVEHQPKIRHPGPEETNGRGLLLVDQLASRWGSDRTGRGKSVWFRIP